MDGVPHAMIRNTAWQQRRDRRSNSAVRRSLKDPGAEGNIVKYITIDHKNVAHLRKALLRGAPRRKLPPLPPDVVERILNAAEYWFTEVRECVKRKVDWPICMDYVFGSVRATGKLKKLEIKIEFFAQKFYHSWRGGRRAPRAWGELEILDRDGKRKMEEPMVMESTPPTNDVFGTQTLLWKVEDIQDRVEDGDTIDFCFCTGNEGSWTFLIRYARMIIGYESQKQQRRQQKQACRHQP